MVGPADRADPTEVLSDEQVTWLGDWLDRLDGKVRSVDVFVGPWGELKAHGPADQPDERAFPDGGVVKAVYLVGDLGLFGRGKARPGSAPSTVHAKHCVLIGETTTVLGTIGTLHGGPDRPFDPSSLEMPGRHYRIRPEDLTPRT